MAEPLLVDPDVPGTKKRERVVMRKAVVQDLAAVEDREPAVGAKPPSAGERIARDEEGGEEHEQPLALEERGGTLKPRPLRCVDSELADARYGVH